MSAANPRSPGTRGMLTGLFPNRRNAETAYRAACDRGYRPEEINLAMSEETRDRWLAREEAARPRAGNGASIGGGAGGPLGALAAIGASVIVPALGLVVSGPLAAGLAGRGDGAIAGGLLDTLVGWDIPEDRARTYEAGLRQGGVVLGLIPRSEEDAQYLQARWRGHGEHVYR